MTDKARRVTQMGSLLMTLAPPPRRVQALAGTGLPAGRRPSVRVRAHNRRVVRDRAPFGA